MLLFPLKGSKVEVIIFNADIPVMSPRIEVYKKYLISNAEVRKIPDEFKTPELTAQWVISTWTIVEEIAEDEEIIPSKFNCTKFTELAQFMDQRDKSVGQYSHSFSLSLYNTLYVIVMFSVIDHQLFWE